jgi:hypothetical protein
MTPRWLPTGTSRSIASANAWRDENGAILCSAVVRTPVQFVEKLTESFPRIITEKVVEQTETACV